MWNPACFLISLLIFQPISAQFFNRIPEELRFTPQHAEILQNFQAELETYFQNSSEEFDVLLNEELIQGRLEHKLPEGKYHPEVILEKLAALQIPTASYNTEISQQCRDDSWLYADSLAKFTSWALKMYDATGKIPDGIASGDIHALGHFEQCLKVNVEDDTGPKLTGKYCTVFLQPREVPASTMEESNPKSVFVLLRLLNLFRPGVDPASLNETIPGYIGYAPSLAFCLPSSCSAEDITAAMASSIGSHVFGQSHIFAFTTEDFCTVAGTTREYDAGSITVITLFSLVALLLVLGTTYDVVLQRTNKSKKDLATGQQILLSFSVLANGKQILNTRNSAEGNLACLHGIRFLSMTWVVIGHYWSETAYTPNANLVELRNDGYLFTMQAISNSYIAVDSFFYLSGLLVAYVTLRQMEKSQGKLNVPLMYLHRYLRLTPMYAFVIAFMATVYVYVGTGPFWGNAIKASEACRNSWWQHLLYINNFFPNNADVNLCMGVSWYLANDMQMFLIAPLFVYALWHWPKKGLALLGGAFVIFTVTIMMIIGVENLPPNFINVRSDIGVTFADFNSDYYQVPWCRIPPYLVGIFMGFLIFQLRNYDIHMKPWLVVTGWSVATVIALLVLYGMYGYLDENLIPTIPGSVSIFYASFHRSAWAVSLSWLVFACIYGYGGFVNSLLSWSGFVPLSRLTYCMFLIHLNWIEFYFARSRTTFYYTTTDAIYGFLATLSINIGLAFIAAVCLEIPFLNLEKLLLPTRRQPIKKADTLTATEEGHVNSAFQK